VARKKSTTESLDKSKPRRIKGEGSISERKDGTWTGRIDLGTRPDGKRNIKCFYGKKRIEVQKKMKEFQKMYESQAAEAYKQTVEEYMFNWLEVFKKPDLADSSYDTLEDTIKNQIVPYIGFVQLANLRPELVQQMLNTLSEKGLSESIVRKAYMAVKACFRNVVAKGYMSNDPMLDVKLPKIDNKEIDVDEDVDDDDEKDDEEADVKFLKEADVRLLYKTCMQFDSNGELDFRYGPHLALILFTGMRVGEALALTWRDVDFEKKSIRVKKALNRVKDRSKPLTEDGKYQYKTIIKTPKTEASERTIYLCSQALEILNFLKEYNHPRSDKEAIYVKMHDGKKKISRNVLTKHLQRMLYILDADNQDIGVHGLRHTFATMMFNANIDVKTISKILGHASVEITYNIYIHVIKSLKQSAVSALELTIL